MCNSLTNCDLVECVCKKCTGYCFDHRNDRKYQMYPPDVIISCMPCQKTFQNLFFAGITHSHLHPHTTPQSSPGWPSPPEPAQHNPTSLSPAKPGPPPRGAVWNHLGEYRDTFENRIVSRLWQIIQYSRNLF